MSFDESCNLSKKNYEMFKVKLFYDCIINAVTGELHKLKKEENINENTIDILKALWTKKLEEKDIVPEIPVTRSKQTCKKCPRKASPKIKKVKKYLRSNSNMKITKTSTSRTYKISKKVSHSNSNVPRMKVDINNRASAADMPLLDIEDVEPKHVSEISDMQKEEQILELPPDSTPTYNNKLPLQSYATMMKIDANTEIKISCFHQIKQNPITIEPLDLLAENKETVKTNFNNENVSVEKKNDVILQVPFCNTTDLVIKNKFKIPVPCDIFKIILPNGNKNKKRVCEISVPQVFVSKINLIIEPIIKIAAKMPINRAAAFLQNHIDNLYIKEDKQGFLLNQTDGPVDGVKFRIKNANPVIVKRDVNSSDINTDDDATDAEECATPFDCHNNIYCQYVTVKRRKNRWNIQLKHGVMHLNGKDYIFEELSGNSMW